jgi:hypothetical protein
LASTAEDLWGVGTFYWVKTMEKVGKMKDLYNQHFTEQNAKLLCSSKKGNTGIEDDSSIEQPSKMIYVTNHLQSSI